MTRTLHGLLAMMLACATEEPGDTADATGSTGGTAPTSTSSAATTSASSTTDDSSTSTPSTTDEETTADPSGDTSGGSSSSGGEDPLEYAGEMNGFRWELPCEDPDLRDECAWDPSLLEGALDDPDFALHRETLVLFGGDPSVVYDVEIRIRGLTEPKDFTGGEVQADHFQIGGTPGSNDYNIYSVEVADPLEVYTLNRNEMGTGHYTFVVDYTVTIPIRGGAEVRLAMRDPNNIAIANPGGSSGSTDPFVVPEIPPFPDPFYGQFLQMDVLSVAPQR